MANYGITGSDLPGVPADLSVDINQRQLSNPNTLKPTSYKFAIGRVSGISPGDGDPVLFHGLFS